MKSSKFSKNRTGAIYKLLLYESQMSGGDTRRGEKKKGEKGRTDEEKAKISRDNAAMRSGAQGIEREAKRARKAKIRDVERESQMRAERLGGSLMGPGGVGPGGGGGSGKANRRKRGAKCA